LRGVLWMFWFLFACLQYMPNTRDDYWDVIKREDKEDDKHRGEEQIDKTQFSSSLFGTICAMGYCEVVKSEFRELMNPKKIVTLRILTGIESWLEQLRLVEIHYRQESGETHVRNPALSKNITPFLGKETEFTG
jgi:hypothetical protein